TEQAIGTSVVFEWGVNGSDPRVARVIELMDVNRERPLAVAELARAVNLSSSYLTRLFLATTGRTPARYDKDRRLDASRELIGETFLTIKEVMAAVGWNDPSHFSREFKRRFGCAPSDLRETAAAEQSTSDQDAIPLMKA